MLNVVSKEPLSPVYTQRTECVMPQTGGGPVGRPKQTNTQDARENKPKGRFNKIDEQKHGE